MFPIDAVRAFYAGIHCRLGASALQVSQGKIRVALISDGVNAWPLYVAQGRRLFKNEGLDVDVMLTGSSEKQLDALTSGDYDIGFQQSDHVVRAVERGADLFIFMALAHAPGLTLIAAPGITSFDGLRGTDIAVDGARTGYALLLRRLLREKGLSECDCVFKEFGGSQERFDALKAGRASASLLNPPFDRSLLADGFNSLGTINQFFPGYPGPVGAARRSWAARHTAQLHAFMRAFDAAYEWLRQTGNRTDAVRLLPARLHVDPNSAERALAVIAGREKPVITIAALRGVIDVVWEAEGYPGPTESPGKYLDLGYGTQAPQSS